MTLPTRLLAVMLVSLLTLNAFAETSEKSLFDEITERAERSAEAPYLPPEADLPKELTELDYDTYRQIRFRPDQALWRDGDHLFEVQLFHPGFLYDQPISLNLVDSQGNVQHLPFEPSRFRYDDNAAPLSDLTADDLGYAGFRLHYPLNSSEYNDEFMVFLGASYFRMVGRDQAYGLSNRGLAIDTAEPQGEEFPAFREFWLVEPEPGASEITVYALLDSPSITGAYRFDIRPGRHTEVDTEAQLFARKDINKLGIAPLTSMFMHGELGNMPVDDYRPRVHDSSGLAMLTGAGEWIWRPLTNPEKLHVSRLQDTSPRGFGLLQRPREFEAYLDTEARYERRPSQWVKPLDDWGKGSVELIEIPTDSETNDNITAYWVPEEPMEAGQSRHFRYRLTTLSDQLPDQQLAHVVRTHQGWGAVPGQDNPPPPQRRQFIVDFQGPALEGLAADQPLKPRISTSSGEIIEPHAQQLPGSDTWRVSFRLAPKDKLPADMRLALTLNDQVLSETWNLVWYPNERR